jgi:SAM-dependent methyltransferase
MDRSDWLKEKRRLAEERMDTLFAPVYDEQWGAYINPSHAQFVQRLVSLCPLHGTLLDAACGTGKYWPLLLASGRSVVGIDQSQAMLKRAQAKFPTIPTAKMGLQEMGYQAEFVGILCVDAMENVFPEDWPLVLSKFYQALQPRGFLYFTVELADPQSLQNAWEASRQLGLPVVKGEWAHEGGYHFYPSIEQVKDWTDAARFDVLEDAVGDDYHHFLVRKR